MARSFLLAATAALALCVAGAQAAPPANIASAVSDAHRPEADTKRDADRKPAETLEFAGIKEGQTVVDLLAGGGYFTRIFSKAVGPSGTVIALGMPPRPPEPGQAPRPDPLAAIASDPAYGNVKAGVADLKNFSLDQKADVIFTAQNYHDFHLSRLGLDVGALNRALYEALKPGGTLVVIDHAAAAGAPATTADSLHRIDPQIIRKEVESAGFTYEGAADFLRNPADDHSKAVFDPSIRGHTDQAVLRFRKPG